MPVYNYGGDTNVQIDISEEAAEAYNAVIDKFNSFREQGVGTIDRFFYELSDEIFDMHDDVSDRIHAVLNDLELVNITTNLSNNRLYLN